MSKSDNIFHALTGKVRIINKHIIREIVEEWVGN